MQKAVASAFDAAKKSASHKALVAALKEKDESKVLEIVSAAIETLTSELTPKLESFLARVRDAAGKAAAQQIKQDALRGLWFDPQTGEDDHGRGPKDTATRSELAKASHKGVTKDKIRVAAESEHLVANLLGGKVMEDVQHNHPIDVTLKHGGRLHGIEVKTIFPGAKSKVTVHPKSRIRKEKWARKAGAKGLHMFAVDRRSGTPVVYHRSKIGSYRLKGMTRVRNAAHAKQLVHG